MKNIKTPTHLLSTIALALLCNNAYSSEEEQLLGCIKNIETEEKYCLKPGERSGYSLPDYIVGQPVEVIAPDGVGVMLSDWDNLSYNRIAVFEENTSNKGLKHRLARNGKYLDFSHPRSMRVVRDVVRPKGCIVSLETNDKFCLEPGNRSGYSLPEFIYKHPVKIETDNGVGVMLSDWDNLSYNRIAVFQEDTSNEDLKNVTAYNGESLDFSNPASMRAVAIEKQPEACIVGVQTGDKFCLTAGQETEVGVGVPLYMQGQEVNIELDDGVSITLSDSSDLNDHRNVVLTEDTGNDSLTNLLSNIGDYIDVSMPRSMAASTLSESPEACIQSRQTRVKYCLPVGQRSGYSLPSYIYRHEVDVIAPEGTGVMLSDWDNLSYNRLAVFTGNTPAESLRDVKAWNGEQLDFSQPQSMRVVSVENPEPEACIISLESGEKYCLKVGQRSGYSLPDFIYAHEVRVSAPNGLGVMLSDWDNLSYNRIAVFKGETPNSALENVQAYNGQELDFSQPKSMRVVEVPKLPEGCIISLETDAKYCLPIGQRSPYSLPEFIYNHEVRVEAEDGAGVMLSDWDNLSYNRVAIFTGNTSNDDLVDKKAWNGEYLDFSQPRSMRVVQHEVSTSSEVSAINGVVESPNVLFTVDFQQVGNSQMLSFSIDEPVDATSNMLSDTAFMKFDNEENWKKINLDQVSYSIPSEASSATIRVIPLQSVDEIKASAWMNDNKEESKVAIVDTTSLQFNYAVEIESQDTVLRYIHEGQTNETLIQFSNRTTAYTPIEVDIKGPEIHVESDISTIHVVYERGGDVVNGFDLPVVSRDINLIVEPGVDAVKVLSTITDDTEIEPNKNFTIESSIPGNENVISNDVTIIDNDGRS